MDAVILYVDCTDPLWVEDYNKTLSKPVQSNRFRSWDTLRYLFRSIAVNAPYIEKIHLVVSRESQVPEWINRDEVHIVLHKDIIPAKFLPTFNSCTIELFIPLIDGLSEEFLYFNDDLFLLNPCPPELFFKKGRPQVSLRQRQLTGTPNTFRLQCYNSTVFAKKCAKMHVASNQYLFPPHWCNPMLKSDCLDLLKKDPAEIEKRISQLRTRDNLNQYAFLVYTYIIGHSDNHDVPYSYVSFREPIQEITTKIQTDKHKLICLNDNNCTSADYPRYKSMIAAAFKRKFPKYCKYEVEYQGDK